MKKRGYVISFFISALSLTAHAGDKALNGGDICENRFQVIRNDLRSWIEGGGSQGLNLSQKASLESYNSNMLKAISAAKVSCTENVLTIGSTEKTCVNFLDDNGSPQIQCNVTRFLQTTDSDQYVLVHHEYAGLAGLEVTVADESEYGISNQISGFLQDQVVKKLVIRPEARPPTQCQAINHSAYIAPGTKCITTNGAVWERAVKANFGESWRGTDGVIWSQAMSEKINQRDASRRCNLIGGFLPTRTNFLLAIANDASEVIPDWRIYEKFWTRDLGGQASEYAYAYVPYTPMPPAAVKVPTFMEEPRDWERNFRCVDK